MQWDCTIRLHGPEALHMPLDSREQRAWIAKRVDVGNAEAFRQADKDWILEQVEAHGSVTDFNTKLALRLLLAPLSYRVDIKLRSSRAGAHEQWDMRPFTSWLDDASASRGAVLIAGAGTGKSTVSAMLLQHEATQGRVAAHHFFKYNDVRRQDPLRIIHSLAFQLAIRCGQLKVLNMRPDVC